MTLENTNLSFRISSGLKNIIGKDLISDKFIAIFELVKNSYDAGAKKVVVSFYEDKNDGILMDYALADGCKGDEIIKLIRTNSILTDILFYSSDTTRMIDSFKAGVPDLDGVYFAKRNLSDGFLDKVRKLIDKIVRRSEDIVNLRGFVLDNTSFFEAKTEEMIYNCYQKLLPDEKK